MSGGDAVRFTGAVVAAQVLVQIGAFTLPALLPHYLAAWSLSATAAGWLIGAFFGAYVLAVPVLVALTDRVPGRRVYLFGALATAASHLGFAFLADGFWSAFLLRALAGLGWAGCYMPGLKAIADRLEGTAQSRAVRWHAAGVGRQRQRRPGRAGQPRRAGRLCLHLARARPAHPRGADSWCANPRRTRWPPTDPGADPTPPHPGHVPHPKTAPTHPRTD